MLFLLKIFLHIVLDYYYVIYNMVHKTNVDNSYINNLKEFDNVNFVHDNFQNIDKVLDELAKAKRNAESWFKGIYGNKNYVEYIIKNRVNTYCGRRCSLNDVQEELPSHFVRVHQRYIVNMKYVTLVKRYEVITRDTGAKNKAIPISRNHFEEVNRKFCLLKGDIR